MKLKDLIIEEQILEEGFKETFKKKILPIMASAGLLTGALGGLGVTAYAAGKNTASLGKTIATLVSQNGDKIANQAKLKGVSGDKVTFELGGRDYVFSSDKAKVQEVNIPDQKEPEFPKEHIGSDTLSSLPKAKIPQSTTSVPKITQAKKFKEQVK